MKQCLVPVALTKRVVQCLKLVPALNRCNI